MGVDIGGLFNDEKISIGDLHDRVISIDAYNVLHQFLASIRQRDGTPLKNSHGQVTSHLSGLFHRTANLVEARIKPIYIFDGKPHPLKAKTIEKRIKRKKLAEIEWKKALDEGDMAKAKSKAQQTSKLTDEMIEQSKELLEALGIPFVTAPSEGESQASYMVTKGDAYAVGSQDFDCLLYGSPILIRNLTSSQKRKLPGKEAYTRVYPKLIRLKPNFVKMGINQKQLVDMSILIGTDYNEGVKGIGPKISLKLIKKSGNIENALSTYGGENPPTFDEIEEIRRIFLTPEITNDYDIKWALPNNEKVIKILVDKHYFSQERIEPIIKKFSNIDKIMRQKTLF